MNYRMFKTQIAGLLLLSFILLSVSLQAQNTTFVIKKNFLFTIPSRGLKTYEINVPVDAKNIRATVKVEDAVRVSKTDKVRTISGVLTIYVRQCWKIL
ncbi:hypothetical protein MNBD_BACTEROID07-2061 [hydrothermal vent metagenome]|uniref:Uncharacterized protein n=1 Tax=hydrothermal vent metagenome TaxID=652676 RepID=A0A3B0UHC0_9ZZZZ